MKAIIVTENGTIETDTDNLIQVAESKGYKHVGYNFMPSQRKELHDTPRFQGLLGAMWDGDKIRYETQRVYDVLSM